MQMKMNTKMGTEEEEKITWSGGACSLSFAMACGGRSGGLWWLGSPVAKWQWLQAVIFLSSFLCFSAFFFSFLPLFFSSFFFRSSAPSLFCSAALPPLFFFFALFPCIYGKNRGERRKGSHYAAAPNRPRGTSPPFFHHVPSKWGCCVGVFLRFKREREGEEKKQGRKSSSSHASRIQRKKKKYGAVQNGTIFASSSSF